jgi:hypothetical protein
MATDKTIARAQTNFTLITALGLAVLAFGLILVMQVFSAQKIPQAWNLTLEQAMPAVFIAGVGLLIATVPWIAWPAIRAGIVKQQEDRWRHDQLMGAVEAQRQVLNALRETSSLSDAAKMITYRAKDREALRLAIREEMTKGDYEAAVALVDDMERRFGYRQEAEQLRDTIDQSWRATRNQQVRDTIEQIETLMARFDWKECEVECQRLLKLNPDHSDVMQLPARIEAARDAHKRDLLRQWKEAVARDDLDRSVVLLTELDQYITRSEAKAYEEAARDVFRKRLQQLGVQFALHVHDKSWIEASRVGRQIIDEFPNTRIAAEVRDKLPILEEKIGTGAAV